MPHGSAGQGSKEQRKADASASRDRRKAAESRQRDWWFEPEEKVKAKSEPQVNVYDSPEMLERIRRALLTIPKESFQRPDGLEPPTWAQWSARTAEILNHHRPIVIRPWEIADPVVRERIMASAKEEES